MSYVRGYVASRCVQTLVGVSPVLSSSSTCIRASGTSVCACVAGGLFLNRSKTIFRVSLSRSAHQRLTLTSTVLRFRGPRGTQEREHLEFLDSFISFSRDINRKSRAPIFFPLREILTRISTLEVELHLLAVDNNAQTLLRQQR